jgi:hypothetical protein
VPDEKLINYRCKITGGRVLDLQLPDRLSHEDAERISAFIETQADDEEDDEPLIPLTGWNMDDVSRITAALGLPATASGPEVATAVRQCTRRCAELEHKLLTLQESHKT